MAMLLEILFQLRGSSELILRTDGLREGDLGSNCGGGNCAAAAGFNSIEDDLDFILEPSKVLL